MEIKKNWKLNDTVMPEDLNRIEGNIEEVASSADSGKEAVENLKNEVNQQIEQTKNNVEEAKKELNKQLQDFSKAHVSKVDFEAKAKELVKKLDSLDEEYVLKCYDTSGEITLPSNAVHNEVDVVCVAGGGGGFGQHAESGLQRAGGERGGCVHHTIRVGNKKTAKIFIGAGGKGNFYYRNQAKGGTTVFQWEETIAAICGYNKNYTNLIGVIEKANLSAVSGVAESNIPSRGNIVGQGVFKPEGMSIPIILPTKEITTYWGTATGDGKNATEYGCGGNGGTDSIGGGDGKQGCVYIGYWRKRG
nr:MAG TPA: Nuclear pore complex protein [Caudoviricetes sp.]